MKRGGEAPADLVLVGGAITTMDPQRPRAEGVAVKDGRVVFVGDAAATRAWIGPNTKVVELHGRSVTPGLVDGHCHLYGLGVARSTLSLRGVTSAADAVKLVAAAVATRGAGEWIRGRGWDQNLWTPNEWPTKELLDAIAPDNPVALRRIDGHSTWVNSAALRAAGITAATADPAGGRILRDAKGEPTGVLVDNAESLVLDKIPAVSREAKTRMILAAQDEALAAGLTGVHEMGIDDDTIAVYRQLAADGKLKLRVYAFLQGEGFIDSLATRTPDRDDTGMARFTLRSVKLYADGSLGSRSAALLAPYADDPPNSGPVPATPEQLAAAGGRASAHVWQLGRHAMR